jgi:hypothetical protein
MEAGYDEVERENERAYVVFPLPGLPEFCGILTTVSGRSLREAKREDRIALEEEMRHEEEKRKRKMAKMGTAGRA